MRVEKINKSFAYIHEQCSQDRKEMREGGLPPLVSTKKFLNLCKYAQQLS